MNNKQYHQVVDALTSLRDSSPLSMTFAGALEQEFQHATGLWNRDSVRLGSLYASLLLVIGYALQWLVGLSVGVAVEAGRLLIVLALLSTAWYASRSRTFRYHYELVALNGLLATLVILSFSYHYPVPFKFIFYGVVIFVQLFIFALMRLPFNASLMLALVSFAVANYVIYLEQLTQQVWLFLAAILLTGMCLALMIGQRIERAARENFLQARLISMERDELKHLNLKLQNRLASDAVTHLLNRRSFEDAMLDEWSQALQRQSKTYLVPMLIQELKTLNEMRGADAGDDLLRAITRAINQCLFDSSDVAARISGCRFCVLLANASQAEIRRRFTRLKRSLANINAFKDHDLVAAGVSLHLEVVEVEPDAEIDARDVIDHVFQRLTPLHSSHDISTLRARSTVLGDLNAPLH